MKDTIDKLEEAQYFLTQMESDPLNYSKFKFNLSAFLSAARSITFVMQKEMSGNIPFNKWYLERQKEFKSDILLNYFNNLRTITIHEKVIRPRKEVHIKLQDKLTLSESVTIFVVHGDGSTDFKQVGDSKTINNQDRSESETKHLWFFEDNDKEDIITMSKKYLVKLSDLVENLKDFLS